MINIIPAIDIIDGKCVRLTQGDYSRKKEYYADPLDAALAFRDAGLNRLHMVDLDGAKDKFPQNLKVLERVAGQSAMEIQYGGGIKSADAVEQAFSSGAAKVICGTVALEQPGIFTAWLRAYGGDKIILGADVRDGFVATHGWLTESQTPAPELIGRFIEEGMRECIVTDISRDGMLDGPNITLYLDLQRQFPNVDIIVSGGISSMEDIVELDRNGLRGVIVGKAFYEGRITMERIKEFYS